MKKYNLLEDLLMIGWNGETKFMWLCLTQTQLGQGFDDDDSYDAYVYGYVCIDKSFVYIPC